MSLGREQITLKQRTYRYAWVWLLCWATVVRAQTPCPSEVNPTLPHATVVAPITAVPGTLAKIDLVTSIVVGLTSGTGEYAVTDKDVWIDLGPKAWKVPSGTLKAGATVFYGLDLTTKDVDLDVPTVVPLYVEDLVHIRLEKKGICGWNNAPDNILDAIFPTPSPRDGEWNLAGVSLYVNGRGFGQFRPQTRLGQGNTVWESPLPSLTLTPEEKFVRCLRVNKNHQDSGQTQELSGVTTEFKKRGISGWMNPPAGVVTAHAIGILRNPPSPGADQYVSLDLEVERVDVNGKSYILDDKHGIRHSRYIRIEYYHVDGQGKDDPRYKAWTLNDRFDVTGLVKWDTDRNGFYEIHPQSKEGIAVISAP